MTTPTPEPTCETCKWWEGRVVGRTYVSGACRRFPPSIGGTSNGSARFPIVGPADYCGEHHERAGK